MQTYLSAEAAAAWAARLARVDYIPLCAETPYAEFSNILSEWDSRSEFDCQLDSHEDEINTLFAAGNAALRGKRVLLAISDQAMFNCNSALIRFAMAGTPMVIVNIGADLNTSRVLTSHTGHTHPAGDNGSLQIYCFHHQELLDCILLGYRLAEHEDVRLPVQIQYCRSVRKGIYELLDLPNATTAKQFVGAYLAASAGLNPGLPASGKLSAMNHKQHHQHHLSVHETLPTFSELAKEFKDYFGRYYPAIESYRSDDADYLFIMQGQLPGTIYRAIDELRAHGRRAGLLRLRLLRPFPVAELQDLLRDKKAIAVIDLCGMPDNGRGLHTEVRNVLRTDFGATGVVLSFVAGPALPQPRDFMAMASMLHQAAQGTPVPDQHIQLPLQPENESSTE